MGILPLNSGTIVVLFDSFCYLHSIYKFLGFGILFGGEKFFFYLASLFLCIDYSDLVFVSKLCQF